MNDDRDEPSDTTNSNTNQHQHQQLRSSSSSSSSLSLIIMTHQNHRISSSQQSSSVSLSSSVSHRRRQQPLPPQLRHVSGGCTSRVRPVLRFVAVVVVVVCQLGGMFSSIITPTLPIQIMVVVDGFVRQQRPVPVVPHPPSVPSADAVARPSVWLRRRPSSVTTSSVSSFISSISSSSSSATASSISLMRMSAAMSSSNSNSATRTNELQPSAAAAAAAAATALAAVTGTLSPFSTTATTIDATVIARNTAVTTSSSSTSTTTSSSSIAVGMMTLITTAVLLLLLSLLSMPSPVMAAAAAMVSPELVVTATTAAATTAATTTTATTWYSSLASTGFYQAFSLVFLSELGDKTFFIAGLLAMKTNRLLALIGSVSALTVMTVISVLIGQVFHVLPTSFLGGGIAEGIPLDDVAAALAFAFFGVKILKEALEMDNDDGSGGGGGSVMDDELAEAEEAVNDNERGIFNSNRLQQMASIFGLVFAAEFGDRSFVSTIALSAAQNPISVAGGAICAHTIATGIAVAGGSVVAKYLSEKVIGIIGGTLFLVFAATTVLGIF